MQFLATPLSGVFVIEPEPIRDNRGYFARAWCSDELQKHGLASTFVQGNLGFSPAPGTVRGIHFQTHPAEEAKIVRCISGALFDVVVDVRPKSATFGRWFTIKLGAAENTSVYIPKGCAHGYQTLEPNTTISYMVSEPYHAKASRSIHWLDPKLAIPWPITSGITISDGDAVAPSFDDLLVSEGSLV